MHLTGKKPQKHAKLLQNLRSWAVTLLISHSSDSHIADVVSDILCASSRGLPHHCRPTRIQASSENANSWTNQATVLETEVLWAYSLRQMRQICFAAISTQNLHITFETLFSHSSCRIVPYGCNTTFLDWFSSLWPKITKLSFFKKIKIFSMYMCLMGASTIFFLIFLHILTFWQKYFFKFFWPHFWLWIGYGRRLNSPILTKIG